MLDFDAPNGVAFKVKGQIYSLRVLSFEDVPAVSDALQVEDLKQKTDLLVELLSRKAECDRPGWWLRLAGKPSPAAAVRMLGVKQQALLFGEWMGELSEHGVVPGES